jgi:hypothetical protein
MVFARSSTATQMSASGVIEAVAAGVMRSADCRDSYGSATARPGILIEPGAANLLTNTTSLATGIGGANKGITTSVVGTGVEMGVSYVDVRFSGTPTGTDMSADGAIAGGRVACSASTAYTLSWYYRILTPADSALQAYLYLCAETSAQSYLALKATDAGGAQQFVAGLTANRKSATWTTPANAGILRVALALAGMTAGTPIDVVVRFGAVQLEAGSVPTSYIPTSGAAATRAGDYLSAPTTSIPGFRSDAGVLVVEVAVSAVGKTNAWPGLFALRNSANAAKLGAFFNDPGDDRVQATSRNATNSANAYGSTGAWAPFVARVPRQFVVGYDATGLIAAQGRVLAGRASRPDAAVYDQLVVGDYDVLLGGTIYRLDYYPRAASDAQLALLTA